MKNALAFIMGILLFNYAFSQLQQSNAIKVVTSSQVPVSLAIDAPKKMDTISLKIDTTDVYKKVVDARNAYDNSFKEISSKVLASSLRLKEAENEIANLESIRRQQKGLTRAQAKQLEQNKLLLAAFQKSIDSLMIQAKKSQEEINKKSSEVTEQQTIKKEYRKEYYDKLLAEVKGNIAILKDNYSSYKTELIAKKDSLSASRWPLYNSNKDSMVREMGDIYSSLIANTKEMLRKLEVLSSDYPELEDKIKKFEEVDVVLQLGGQPDSYIDSLFLKRKLDLANRFSVEKDHNDEFKKSYDQYRNDFKDSMAKINSIKLKYKPIEDNKQSSDASMLANFTQPLNQSSSLVPGIDIFAYKKYNFEQYSIYGQAKLFVASPGSDTNSLNHATKYFIPEASQLGFMLDFNFGFLPATNGPVANSKKMLGINLSFYYLQKQLSTRDTLKNMFSTGMVQLRGGLELILIKNALAVYGNLNGYFVGKGVDNFSKNYVNDTRMKWFSEFGLKSYLVLQSDAKINLLLDLRFLPVNGTIREMTLTNDKFIPVFKLGIVKEFDF